MEREMTKRNAVRRPMRVRVRQAVAADWPFVAGLLVELGRPDARAMPDQGEAGRRAFERYLRQRDVVAFVAETAGSVVGFIDLELRTWMSIPGIQAWIPDLIVTERARGRGVGSALLSRAEEFARAKRCRGMALESGNWREGAHAFYASHGWTPVAQHFQKAFDEVTGSAAQGPLAS
jgi:GNAT superfamily N-acetyltransferase